MGKKLVKVKSTKKGKTKKKKTSADVPSSMIKMDVNSSAKQSFDVLFVDDNKGCKSSETISLQEAFMKFRDRKQDEVLTSKKKINKNSEPSAIWDLRMKFLERCKNYIGVPYKKKYHQPGIKNMISSSNNGRDRMRGDLDSNQGRKLFDTTRHANSRVDYNSNLFLDCCGLIRRVLRDLSQDFGFRIGPWNQAYMYDTLPVVVDKEEEMQPGDLVFISGVYFNKKMRSQPHNMVHVEVWMGDGIKTIGARWHKGRVQVFDSYRFESTSYHSMTYHFRSINTWLLGICESHCHRHPWKRKRYFQPSEKSVFFHAQAPSAGDRHLTSSVVGLEDDNVQDASDNEALQEGLTSPPSDEELKTDCESRVNVESAQSTSKRQSIVKYDCTEDVEHEKLNSNNSFGLNHETDPLQKVPLKYFSFAKKANIHEISTSQQPSHETSGDATADSFKENHDEPASSSCRNSFSKLHQSFYFFTSKKSKDNVTTKNLSIESELSDLVLTGKCVQNPKTCARSSYTDRPINALADRMVAEALEHALTNF